MNTIDINEYIKLGRKVHTYVAKKTEFGGDVTVRQIAHRFHMRFGDIITLVEDNDDLTYNIGIRVGSGIYEHKNIGDYTVEKTD